MVLPAAILASTPRTLALAVAVVWLVGCGETAEDGAPEPPPTRTPTPYVPDLPPDDVQQTTLDEAALGRLMAEQIPALVRSDLSAVPGIIEGFADLTDPECPGAQVDGADGYSVVAFEADCVNGDGVRIRGYLNLTRISEDEGASTTAVVEGNDLRIEAPDGRFIELSGYFSTTDEAYDGAVERGSYLSARLRADAQTAAGNPWLVGTFQGRIERFSYAQPDGAVVGLSGAVTLSGETDLTLSISALRLNSWACGQEAAGVFSVREPSGTTSSSTASSKKTKTQRARPPRRGPSRCATAAARTSSVGPPRARSAPTGAGSTRSSRRWPHDAS